MIYSERGASSVTLHFNQRHRVSELSNSRACSFPGIARSAFVHFSYLDYSVLLQYYAAF